MNKLTMVALAAGAVVSLASSAIAQSKIDSPEYKAMIEASKSEEGLLVYSNLPGWAWKDFLPLLAQTYPWVKMETTDMGAELWERYFAESAAGTRTADLITTGAPDRFADFIDRGQADPYVSSEIDALPEWSRPEPGLYTLSAAPAILAYNKFTVQQPPKSIRDLTAMVEAKPEQMKGKISTYDATTNPFGTAMFATWLEGEGNNWDVLSPLGSATRPESGAGTQREKLMTGEYDVAFFWSSLSIVTLERPEVKQVLGWEYIADGTPVQLQGLVKTKASTSPNTAKIVLDLMLSREGQIALAKSGLTPYRNDVAQEGLPYPTLKTAADKIGENNLIYNSYDRAKIASWPKVVEKFDETFKK